jgi:hypothetical protein
VTRARATACGTVALVLVCASVAVADTTRPDYVAQVEPICKANGDANAHIFRGVRAKVKHGKLKQAGAQFSRSAVALAKTIGLISAVPQPSLDQPQLTNWLTDLDAEQTALRMVAKFLKAEKRGRAQASVVKLTSIADQANSDVFGFGFHYCLIDPAKFT